VPQLDELLYKTIQYAKSMYKEAIFANEAAIHTENVINKFIKEYKISEEGNNADCND